MNCQYILKSIGYSFPTKWHNVTKFGIKQVLISNTLDADSTVKSVCGNQEGAEKGFYTTLKGAKSYHPLLVFVSEMKLLYRTRFRTASAYTAYAVVEFLKDVQSSLPQTIRKVFIATYSKINLNGRHPAVLSKRHKNRDRREE
jgi:hypothetical protein